MSTKIKIETEILRIAKGKLGPIQQDCELEIRPLTVFIGPQGTGKSLVSQLLYFLRDARYLLAKYSGNKVDQSAVRKVVEGLRTGDASGRPLASFLTTPSARVEYRSGNSATRILSIHKSTNQIRPLGTFRKEVTEWFNAWLSGKEQREYIPKAWFIPAERMFFSRFINTDPGKMGDKALPYTMREFAQILSRSGETYQAQKDDLIEPIQFLETLVNTEMRGQIHYSRKGRHAGKWQWEVGTDRVIEIEMASSGQMEAWPLIFAAQNLFRLPEERPLYLHIEEPESHLHPRAQVAISKLIAYLINQGVKVIITTHSLIILYALNNLSLAYQKLGKAEKKGVPSAEVRIPPDQVSAYLFDGHKPAPIVDEHGQIDEGLLGEALGSLEAEFNRLLTYQILWE